MILGANKIIKEMEYFVNKDINIFFSAYPHFRIAERTDDMTGNPFVVASKYLDKDIFFINTDAMINKNGNGYEITVGKSKMCMSGKETVKCKKNSNTVWSINRKEFGYTISQGGLCLSKLPETVLKLQSCTETNDQLFDFKLLASLSECGDNKNKDGKNKTSNNLQPLTDAVIGLNDSNDRLAKLLAYLQSKKSPGLEKVADKPSVDTTLAKKINDLIEFLKGKKNTLFGSPRTTNQSTNVKGAKTNNLKKNTKEKSQEEKKIVSKNIEPKIKNQNKTSIPVGNNSKQSIKPLSILPHNHLKGINPLVKAGNGTLVDINASSKLVLDEKKEIEEGKRKFDEILGNHQNI